MGRRDLCWLLHPGAHSLGPAWHPEVLGPAGSTPVLHTATGAELAWLVTSAVTGAVASAAGPAVVRCLACVQRAALIKIKGLFHYGGSPSNYAPAISCGSLQAIQGALGWAGITLQLSEPQAAAAPSLGRTGLLVATALGLGLALGRSIRVLPPVVISSAPSAPGHPALLAPLTSLPSPAEALAPALAGGSRPTCASLLGSVCTFIKQ